MLRIYYLASHKIFSIIDDFFSAGCSSCQILHESSDRKFRLLIFKFYLLALSRWSLFFDGNFRRSGKDGVYCNEFINENEILETCNIDDASEYVKKRSNCKPVRFVFSKSKDNECTFEGIFYQVSIDMYMCNGKLIGETILRRYDEYEKYL